MKKSRGIGSPSNSIPLPERWFYPIVEKIEEFENANHVFDFMESPLSDNTPSWTNRCLIKCIEPYWQQCGLGPFARLDARTLGAHIGAKASVCDAKSRGFKVLSQLKGKDRRAWVDWFGGAEEFKDALTVGREFADVLTPKFSKVRTEALGLVMLQPLVSLVEQIAFHQDCPRE